MADREPERGDFLDAILTISEADSRSFSTAEIIAIAKRPEAVRLRAAMVAIAGKEFNARKLGRLLRRCEGREIDGLIRRQDRDMAGWVWELAEGAVTRCPSLWLMVVRPYGPYP